MKTVLVHKTAVPICCLWFCSKLNYLLFMSKYRNLFKKNNHYHQTSRKHKLGQNGFVEVVFSELDQN